MLVGYTLFSEKITPKMIMGVGLIIGGITIINIE
jgi:multidrug transporter EmrE-like cation transporter